MCFLEAEPLLREAEPLLGAPVSVDASSLENATNSCQHLFIPSCIKVGPLKCQKTHQMLAVALPIIDIGTIELHHQLHGFLQLLLVTKVLAKELCVLVVQRKDRLKSEGQWILGMQLVKRAQRPSLFFNKRFDLLGAALLRVRAPIRVSH